jgi:uncharacterized protein (DUF1330 family)
MPAYVIFCLTEVSDPEALAKYRAAGRSVMPASMKFLAGPNVATTLEGPPMESVVLLEFASRAEAEAWYQSDEYQAIVGTRLGAATGFAFIVESR